MAKPETDCAKCGGQGWYVIPTGPCGETPEQCQCEECGGFGSIQPPLSYAEICLTNASPIERETALLREYNEALRRSNTTDAEIVRLRAENETLLAVLERISKMPPAYSIHQAQGVARAALEETK